MSKIILSKDDITRLIAEYGEMVCPELSGFIGPAAITLVANNEYYEFHIERVTPTKPTKET